MECGSLLFNILQIHTRTLYLFSFRFYFFFYISIYFPHLLIFSVPFLWSRSQTNRKETDLLVKKNSIHNANWCFFSLVFLECVYMTWSPFSMWIKRNKIKREVLNENTKSMPCGKFERTSTFNEFSCQTGQVQQFLSFLPPSICWCFLFFVHFIYFVSFFRCKPSIVRMSGFAIST